MTELCTRRRLGRVSRILIIVVYIWGTKHAPLDLKADIESLMSSLDENKIYRIQKGRTIRDKDIVKDVVAMGLQNLMSGEKNPISDYNAALK